MNDDQWKFIFKHYPEFGAAPYDMIVWLFGESKRIEDQNADAYGKPKNSGISTHEEEDTLESGDKYDRSMV
jgi:hypothetical protein